MSGTERGPLFIFASALLAVPRVASAQPAPLGTSASAAAVQPTPLSPSANTAAAAQSLFVEGRHLVEQGRYAEGCAKLEQSQRLDPAAGTEINLADCYEKSGKIASAWVAFHEAATAAQRSGRAEWAEQARERARVLEPSVPHLTIVVDEPVPELDIRRGSVPIESSTLGSPVPVDPGAYEVTAAAPRHRRWSTGITVEASEHVVLHVPALAEEAREPAPRTLVMTAPPLATAARPPERAAGSVQRTAGLTLGALAIVWIGAGAFLGARAIADNSEAANRCPTSPRCNDPRAVTLTGDARRAADASTVAAIAGATLLGAAATLFFTAPSSRVRPSLAIGPAGANMVLSGPW